MGCIIDFPPHQTNTIENAIATFKKYPTSNNAKKLFSSLEKIAKVVCFAEIKILIQEEKKRGEEQDRKLADMRKGAGDRERAAAEREKERIEFKTKVEKSDNRVNCLYENFLKHCEQDENSKSTINTDNAQESALKQDKNCCNPDEKIFLQENMPRIDIGNNPLKTTNNTVKDISQRYPLDLGQENVNQTQMPEIKLIEQTEIPKHSYELKAFAEGTKVNIFPFRVLSTFNLIGLLKRICDLFKQIFSTLFYHWPRTLVNSCCLLNQKSSFEKIRCNDYTLI
jgi:hypothetical protein